MARLFGVGKLDGVERVTAFGEFEGFDELFLLEVLKEFDDRVTGVALFVTTGFFKAALFEEILEGERRYQLPVRLDFNDSAQDIVLEFDVHFCVLLTRHVEESGLEGEDLPFEVSDLPHGRLVEKLNHYGFPAVDCGFGDAFAGQKWRENFKSLATVAVEQ